MEREVRIEKEKQESEREGGRGSKCLKKQINRRKAKRKQPRFQPEFADFFGHPLAKIILPIIREKSGCKGEAILVALIVGVNAIVKIGYRGDSTTFAPFVAPLPCVLRYLVRFMRFVSGGLIRSYG